jgi:Gas vesicle protein
MARRTASDQKAPSAEPVAHRVLEPPEASLLDLLDRLLDKGVMANGDVMLGVAGIDLIYVRVAALLCGADRVLPRHRFTPARPSRHKSRRGRLFR